MDWHNFRLTRRLPDGSMHQTTGFERSVKEIVEDDVFHNRGVFDVHSVEFSGPAGGVHFMNVTESYKDLYHAMTHETPPNLARR